MKIIFNIQYRTNWGESLYMCGDIPQLGGGNDKEAVELRYLGDEHWQLTLELPENTNLKSFSYRYIVKAENAPWRLEWGEPHRFQAATGNSRYDIYDCWQDQPMDMPYYSSAFVNGMLHRDSLDTPLTPRRGNIYIRINAPMVQPSQVVAIAGEDAVLGSWNVKHAIRLNDAHYPEWEAEIPLSAIKTPCEYKFLILDRKSGDVVAWEGRNNRVLDFSKPSSSDGDIVVVAGMRFVNPLTPWKGAGTAIPVFSVRTEEDFGVGDFVSLKKMVDWCKLTGQKILQLLPINDTTMTGTWTDSYPYNANSTFALHPMYIRLQQVGRLKDPKRQTYYDAMARRLNDLPMVDYEQVNQGKIAFLKEIFPEQRRLVEKREDYKRFVADNEHWLRPYAAFCTLRDIYGTACPDAWKEYSVYDEEKINSFCRSHEDEIHFVYFLQYHLDAQLRDVREYAHSNGVVLKGDIPIGISRTSVDAWVYPHLFYMNCQAGAPPDAFSTLGQNWGFPTYNWEEMARDGFAWWKARFAKMAEYFDAYRIDHVLGFFRIWQIPTDAVHGLLGIFHPALPFHPDELRSDYDFWLNPDTQAKPLILEWMLTDFFGPYTDDARKTFLVHTEGDRYRLQDFVDTQRKVVDYFASWKQEERTERLRDGLLGLIDNILFIEDPYEKGKYHPRISAQFTYQYRCLSDYERWCFDRLYNDFFYHRHNDFWYGKAMWKLPPLTSSSPMLCCAEDLGMIPDCVPAVMNQLQILSLEIQRMPKDPTVEFGNTWSYPYYSVCTSSTHDMPGIRSWWESDHAMSQRYYNQVLHEGGEAPYFAEPWICDKMVGLQLDSPSMLCILPLQDWLSMDGDLRRENPEEEIINIPAISRHYWRYRMHITVEKLLASTTFNEHIRKMVEYSGR